MTQPCPQSFLSWRAVPSAMTRPFDIIMILSDTHSASYMLWVVISTVCFRRSPRISFHVWSRTRASMPVVGSSRITNYGPPTRLKARESRLLIPPEKVVTLPSIFFSRPTLSNAARIFCLSTCSRFSLWKNSRCSPAVISSQRMSNCGQTPMIFLMLAISPSTLMPEIMASPRVFARAPMRMLMRVDFPAPFSPSSATISPRFRDAVTPVRAQTLLLQIFCRLVILTRLSSSPFSQYPEAFLFLSRQGSTFSLYPRLLSTKLSSSHSAIRKEIDVMVRQVADSKGEGRTQVCGKGFWQLLDCLTNMSSQVNSVPSTKRFQQVSMWLSALRLMSLKSLLKWKEGQTLKRQRRKMTAGEALVKQSMSKRNPPVKSHCITTEYSTNPQRMLIPNPRYATAAVTHSASSPKTNPFVDRMQKSNRSSPLLQNLKSSISPNRQKQKEMMTTCAQQLSTSAKQNCKCVTPTMFSPIRKRFSFCTSSRPPSITNSARQGSMRKKDPYCPITETPCRNRLVCDGKSANVNSTSALGLQCWMMARSISYLSLTVTKSLGQLSLRLPRQGTRWNSDKLQIMVQKFRWQSSAKQGIYTSPTRMEELLQKTRIVWVLLGCSRRCCMTSSMGMSISRISFLPKLFSFLMKERTESMQGSFFPLQITPRVRQSSPEQRGMGSRAWSGGLALTQRKLLSVQVCRRRRTRRTMRGLRQMRRYLVRLARTMRQFWIRVGVPSRAGFGGCCDCSFIIRNISTGWEDGQWIGDLDGLLMGQWVCSSVVMHVFDGFHLIFIEGVQSCRK